MTSGEAGKGRGEGEGAQVIPQTLSFLYTFYQVTEDWYHFSAPLTSSTCLPLLATVLECDPV